MLSLAEMRAAELAYLKFLQRPEYFAQLLLDPTAWASSADVQCLETYISYSALPLKLNGARSYVFNAVRDKYGTEARDALTSAWMSNRTALAGGMPAAGDSWSTLIFGGGAMAIITMDTAVELGSLHVGGAET